MDDKLTPKQLMFVREYVVDLNATQACIRAGYSPKTAFMQGSRMLSKDKVAAKVQKLMDERSERVGLSADEILKSILRIGKKAEADDKYSDALKAQELLGKHRKLFTDKVESTGTMTLQVVNEFE